MVTQSSRRAFLTGLRSSGTPWGQFCARLTRSCAGQVRWDRSAPAQQAWLAPARAQDVVHALALCRELGVQCILLNSDACPDPQRPILWVDSRAAWAAIESPESSNGVWRIDAGVQLGTLQEKNAAIFNAMVTPSNAAQTVAQWFAQPFCEARFYRCIVQAEVLLADGSSERFAAFGTQDGAPLRSLSVQSRVPKLFELAQSASAQRCAHSHVWPLRYHLDALMSHVQGAPHLAWLFAGHGGSLGWLQTIWIQNTESYGSDSPGVSQPTVVDARPETEVKHIARALDQAIKQILDPTGVFGKLPTAVGIE